jgi:DNA-binding MarR family transcriptional regulator
MPARQQPSPQDPSDPSFRFEESLFYWLVRVVHRYGLRMDEVLKRIGMDLPKWRVLMILTELPSASVSELAEHSVLRLSTMTKVVQRLEQDGLVKTGQSPRDARVTEVFLTERGVEAVASVRGQASRIYRLAIEGVDGDERTILVDLLRRVSGNLDGR